ncbi:MAG: synthase subunit epsilon [Hyphomicrobiales bacterium]|nr:synthase subunit epsilon [Hyphomicrobiales bacterium]
MAAFHFELVSPERLIFSGEVEQVVVPGSEGQFTVLSGHSPMMSMLRPGVVEVAGRDLSERLFVRGGFADISPTGLTILAEQAIPLAELDAAQIEKQIRAAEEDLEDAQTDETRQAAAMRLDQLRELRSALSI